MWRFFGHDLFGKDETDGEMVVWFQEELAIPGGKRADFFCEQKFRKTLNLARIWSRKIEIEI